MTAEHKAKRKKIFDIIFSVILGIAIVMVIIGIITKVTGKDILPYKIYWVMTDSMEPEIPAKSFIVVKVCDADEIEVDDIITFISTDPEIAGQANTHKVVEIIGDHDEFITKGTNNVGADKYHALGENIIGKRVCNLKLLSVIGRFYSTPYGFAGTAVLILAVMVILMTILDKKFKRDAFNRRVQEEVERLEREHTLGNDIGIEQESEKKEK